MRRIPAGRGAQWLALALSLRCLGGMAVGMPLLLTLSGCPERAKHEELYYCPMHPTYIKPGPGECPICGMDLVPKPKDVPAPAPADSGSGARSTTTGSTQLAPLELSAEQVQLLGIRTATVEAASARRELRAVGVVKPDASRLHTVTAKVEGYVEKLWVTAEGEAVRAGAPILSVYSPELVAGQDEYLSATKALARLRESGLPETRAAAEGMVEASRQRLLRLDVPPSGLRNLDESGVSTRAITLLAPANGVVQSKSVSEGSRIEPGQPLYTLADLSRVWIEAALPEQDARGVAVGTPARVTQAYDPGRVYEGKVAFVSPLLDAASRSLPVRIELSNADLTLKPGMYAEVWLQAGGEVSASSSSSIPADALLDSGLRQIVFVRTGETSFQPREVRAGRRGAGRVAILEGLRAGEEVVTQAAFLLDSEARLRSAFSAATPSEHTH